MNTDAATLIANNLGALPAEDGTLLQFIQYNTLPGSPEQQQQAGMAINRAVADAIINLLTINGYTITKTGQPADAR